MNLSVSFQNTDDEVGSAADGMEARQRNQQVESGYPGVVPECQARGAPPLMLDIPSRRSPSEPLTSMSPPSAAPSALAGSRRPCLGLKTPTSCRTPSYVLSPTTPDPSRSDLILLRGYVGAILFDFDGTLTASPGDAAQRSQKQVELVQRAPMLAPRLRAMHEAGFVLGIISKSSKPTIDSALREACLAEYFTGPILGKAVGFEGKAGFIADMVDCGELHELGVVGADHVLLVDDDVRELDRARARGIQTYAAPPTGGLQEQDFEAIFDHLGLVSLALLTPKTPNSVRSCKTQSPARPCLSREAQWRMRS